MSTYTLRNQSFVRLTLYNKNSFIKKLLSYPLHPGRYRIMPNNKNSASSFFRMDYMQPVKNFQITSIPIVYDRVEVSIDDFCYNQLLKFDNEALMTIEWDKIDDLKNLTIQEFPKSIYPDAILL